MSNYSKNLKRKTRRRNRSKSTSRYHHKYPRLVVYRSNKHFESQIINDFDGITLISCSSKDSVIKKDLSKVKNKTELSVVVGKNLEDELTGATGFLIDHNKRSQERKTLEDWT